MKYAVAYEIRCGILGFIFSALAENFKSGRIISLNYVIDFAKVFFEKNKLVNLPMDFSFKIIKLCEKIKGHYSLVNQLERSAASIGVNIHEAKYAHGKADLINREIAKDLYNQCGTIRRILIASINSAKTIRTDFI